VCGENADAGDACLARVRESTEGAPYEIVQARRCAAAVNAAVAASAAEQVVLLDAALDVRGPGWLTALLEYAQQPAIGAVGGRISYPDGRFRHIGIVVGVGRGVDRPLHAHLKTPGYFTSAIGVRNYSAVSAECLMTSRALFQELGGLDEALPWSVADVDYCLKARRASRRVVFTPYADAQIRAGVEPAPLPDADAISALRARWGETLERDPYYNPNFDKVRADYSLEQM
jgi:GT2 family glycosyltransferase